MLDGDDDTTRRRLAETVGLLPWNVNLPKWARCVDKSGQMSASRPNDERRHARMQLATLAGLEYRQTSPALPRRSEWHKVYVKDISLSGLAFLHGEQLYPLERMKMVLPDERLLKLLPNRISCIVEVVRCSRLNERCYLVGADFVDEYHTA